MTGLENWLPSEADIEAFLRGEGDLEFRSLFDMDTSDAKVITRKADDNSTESQFMVIKGIITTANEDDNGVEIVPDALRTLPNDFKRRNTFLWNHQSDFAIGTIGQTRFRPRTKPTARVDVDQIFVDVESRAPDGVRFVDKIERGILSKLSFGWATRDGVFVFLTRKDVDEDELKKMGIDPEEAVWSFRFGLDNAPKIRVLSLTGTEISLVSVPADADADIGIARFQRNLANVLYKEHSNHGILVPEQYQAGDDGQVVVPIRNFLPGESSVEFEVVEEESESPVEDTDTQEKVSEPLVFTMELSVSADELAESLGKLVTEKLRDVIGLREDYTNQSYKKTPTIDRPWDEQAAIQRLSKWAKGDDDEFDLTKSSHRNKFRQASVGWRGEGTHIKDYFLIHHDFVNGRLVSNFRAVANAAARYDQTKFVGASEKQGAEHLISEYRNHGKEPPEGLVDATGSAES